jgi:hypothetical protein
VDNTRLLDSPWPNDLDPATVEFKGRSETVLRRNGLYDDWSLFNELTEAAVERWWNTGPVTVEDIRDTGDVAVRLHHETVGLRRRIDIDLTAVALESWAPHIWHPDPRFAEFIPKGDSTVYDIATSGTALDRHALWNELDALRAAVGDQAGLSLPAAVSEHIEAVAGQHGQRLDILLRVTGLNGFDPITGADAGRLLGVSSQRIYQIVRQMESRLVRARPRDGAWLPQLVVAEETRWPSAYTKRGIRATRATFCPSACI